MEKVVVAVLDKNSGLCQQCLQAHNQVCDEYNMPPHEKCYCANGCQCVVMHRIAAKTGDYTKGKTTLRIKREDRGMIKKYRTGGYECYIKEIEIEKETLQSVWINGRACRKWTKFYKYHNSWKKAKLYLFTRAVSRLAACSVSHESAKENFAKIKNLR